MLPSRCICEELRQKEPPACWTSHNLLPWYRYNKYISMHNDWTNEICILLGDSKLNVKERTIMNTPCFWLFQAAFRGTNSCIDHTTENKNFGFSYIHWLNNSQTISDIQFSQSLVLLHNLIVLDYLVLHNFSSPKLQSFHSDTWTCPQSVLQISPQNPVMKVLQSLVKLCSQPCS